MEVLGIVGVISMVLLYLRSATMIPGVDSAGSWFIVYFGNQNGDVEMCGAGVSVVGEIMLGLQV